MRLATYCYIGITKLWSMLMVEEDNFCCMDIDNIIYNAWSSGLKCSTKWFQKCFLNLDLMVDSDELKLMIGMEFYRCGNQWKNLFKLLEWKVWISLLQDRINATKWYLTSDVKILNWWLFEIWLLNKYLEIHQCYIYT